MRRAILLAGIVMAIVFSSALSASATDPYHRYGYYLRSPSLYSAYGSSYYSTYGRYAPTGIWWLERPSIGAYYPPTFGGSTPRQSGAYGQPFISYGYRYNVPGDPSSGFAPGRSALQFYYGP